MTSSRLSGSCARAFFIVSLFLAYNVYSQEPVDVNGKRYIRVDGSWNVEYQGERFKVVDTILTIGWRSDADPYRVARFLENEGAVVLRQNVLGFTDVKIQKPNDLIQTLRRFLRDEYVRSVDVSTQGRWGTTYPPPVYSNDSLFAKQWCLNQSNGHDIKANQAWGYTTGSSNVLVCDIGPGVDWRHRDLGMGTDSYQNIWLNPGEDAWSNPDSVTSGNHLDDDGNGYVDDWKGWNFETNSNNSIGSYPYHGTMVTGIMVAKTNNGIVPFLVEFPAIVF